MGRNGKWIKLADMHVSREFITNSCLEYDGYLWVFGGYDREIGKSLNSVEVYDPKTNTWMERP